jgi:uncharacterized membrane protein YidH (DUF202 family)
MVASAATLTDSGLAARMAAVSSLGAAVIHFAVTPSHFAEWVPSGIFFATLALFQLLWGVLAWTRPPVALLAAGIAANLGALALWVVSHTQGSPFGPHAGETEAIRAAGICTLLLECYVVMGAAWAWHRRRRPETVSGAGAAMVLIGAAPVIAAVVAVGVISGLQPHGHHGQPGDQHRAGLVVPAAEAGHEPGGHHDHGG